MTRALEGLATAAMPAAAPRSATFLSYRRGVHAWRAAALVAVAALAYALHDPFDGPNGGTWLGYTLGTIGALLIVWLTLFGVRKRSYRSMLGTVEGWLSAHVYFGIALLVIATLHSGGELRWNVHGAAYVLMTLVVATGLVGIYLYRRFPSLIAQGRGGVSRQRLLEEASELDRRCLAAAQPLGEEVYAATRSAVERTALGGSWWAVLRGRDESTVMIDTRARRPQPNPDQGAIIAFLAERLGKSGGAAETLWLQQLIDLSAKRQSALRVAREDLRRQALLSVWLDLHVPLTFALWGALTAHIVSVFVYW